MKTKNFWGGIFLMAWLQCIQATAVPELNQAILSLALNSTEGASVTPCSKTLFNCTIVVLASGCPQTGGNSVTITNTSTVPALNIAASSSDPNYINYVIQSNGCPTALAPGASCTISFYLNANTTFSTNNVAVKGTNTNTTLFNILAFTCI